MQPYQTTACLVVAAVLLASCGRPSSGDTAAAPAAPTEFMTVGTVNSVNTEAGTVNISHSPVPAAGWPAMTMDFKVAHPAEAAAVKPGDRVDMHFTIESGMNATLTHLAPITPHP